MVIYNTTKIKSSPGIFLHFKESEILKINSLNYSFYPLSDSNFALGIRIASWVLSNNVSQPLRLPAL